MKILMAFLVVGLPCFLCGADMELPKHKSVEGPYRGILFTNIDDNIQMSPRSASKACNTPQQAYSEITSLFKNSEKRIKSWTTIEEYYVFSLDDDRYRKYIFVKIGGKECDYNEIKEKELGK